MDSIYSLFAEVCLPQHRGAQLPALDALGLVSYVPKDGNLLWIDPLSETFLKFDDRSCSIQFHDRKTGLTRDQGNALANMIAGLVETEFPSLRLDPEVKLQETAMTKAWMAGEFAKPWSHT
ncbi:hypothetical protein [Shimia sp. CNT1-13L.2]|uniref:hypothetical protein n=1 Tax=Shimia sp. CNT1-13L.2 TaxID=2959663 RepID=UPI0020CC3B90|nr:hypothetical protein [Shimia sp. CNT1-13L.2]